MNQNSRDIAVSIRLNPFKQCDLQHLPFDSEVPWSPFGRYLSQRPSFTLDPLFHAGAYYVQDASAMFVGHAFRQACAMLEGTSPVMRVLDLCAAPGGKTTDIASSLRLRSGSSWTLVSNEVIRSRAAVLCDNVAVWGDPNVCVTSSDPGDFSRVPGLFDIIVADVPCSGEGMFRKSENAREMFSDENVRLCAARARRIVADSWDALKSGGIMVFSTCTYSREENDGNVEWICENLGAEPLSIDATFEVADLPGPQRTDHGFMLNPEIVKGEGQYCALLRKNGGGELRPCGNDEELKVFPEDKMSLYDRNGEIYALGEDMSAVMDIAGKKLNVLQSGVHAFSIKGRDRIPCADLALSHILDPDDFPSVELDMKTALSYLHKDALNLTDSPRGFLVVKYLGMPLGFVNNLGNRANNLHPASRRILMNLR